MKKNNKFLKGEIAQTSFQTQLFLIILICFILFIIFDYAIIQYAFKNRYISNEIQNTTQDVESFAKEINDGDEIMVEKIENFIKETGSIPLFVNTETGAFSLNDPINTSYSITVSSGDSSYNVIIPDYSIKVSINDLIQATVEESYYENTYIAKKITVNGKIKLNDDTSSSIIISGSATEVFVPQNLNFEYETNPDTSTALQVVNTNLSKFENSKSKESSYFSYYFDQDRNSLFILIKPSSFSETSNYILIISSFVQTKSLLSVVSSYYGYIVLVSIILAILIALFIARAFSNPIKIVENEMRGLANENYDPTDHNFKNKELISLQDTLNSVKHDTKEKVESIQNQKESLEKLNNEILKEEELRKSFISRLSHELKTPLMVISASTEAMMDGVIPDDERNKEYETILEEVDKTTTIIKDIINTYKTSAKEVEINLERFDLNELIEEILNPLLPIASNNKLKVEINLKQKIFMDGDRELIGQVVSNFITNAFKYTKQNGKVEINLINTKYESTFEVKNYGSKISEENLEKIWLPFFRERNDVDDSSTGMGLYIVKEILAAHNLKYGVVNFNDGVRSFFVINKKDNK